MFRNIFNFIVHIYILSLNIFLRSTHMDGWRRMGSRVSAGAEDGGRRGAGLEDTGSKTFLCPRLQDRAEIEIKVRNQYRNRNQGLLIDRN